MDMGRVMLLGVELVHVNQDAIKRTDEWHSFSFADAWVSITLRSTPVYFLRNRLRAERRVSLRKADEAAGRYPPNEKWARHTYCG